MSKLHKLAQLGQAIWLDDLRRSYLTSGELAHLVEMGLRGLTSNPTILDKAIEGGSDYDQEIRDLARAGKSAKSIREALAISDIRGAADILRPVYDQSQGTDGYVSLEVGPELAHDTAGTISEASRLFTIVERPNVFIKIPATQAGIPAIQASIARGININVTLIFSLGQYEQVTKAYLAGLESLAAAGGDLSRLASVASFFVSRVDTAVDKALQAVIANPGGARAAEQAHSLLGQIAIANARVAYARFQEIFAGQRWAKLEAQGARPQRPLWASTSTKDPAYSDTLYVDNLIGPHTVNTLPFATLQAFLDHGVIARTVDQNVDQARRQLAGLAALGVDLAAITSKLLEDGVAAFAASWEALVANIARKREQVLKGG
jgi:transaldolase